MASNDEDSIDTPFDPDRDNEAAYDREIAPLMHQISARCRELGLPFVAMFVYRDGSRAAWVALPLGTRQHIADIADAMLANAEAIDRDSLN